MGEPIFEHLRYLDDRHYRREVHAALRQRLRRQRLRFNNRFSRLPFCILCQEDGSCCVVESRAETVRRIFESLGEDGELGERMAIKVYEQRVEVELES